MSDKRVEPVAWAPWDVGGLTYTVGERLVAYGQRESAVVTRCPPGFSAYEGGEHDASLFERGFDAFADALLARFGMEE
ncbi:MAG: hypothetical protein AMXMBFR53_30160 [Gemmatimonadota bacterium]